MAKRVRETCEIYFEWSRGNEPGPDKMAEPVLLILRGPAFRVWLDEFVLVGYF